MQPALHVAHVLAQAQTVIVVHHAFGTLLSDEGLPAAFAFHTYSLHTCFVVFHTWQVAGNVSLHCCLGLLFSNLVGV